jgi:hypothetical protein
MANKINTTKDEAKRSTKVDLSSDIVTGEVTIEPRETTFIETKGKDVADIVSNPVYPLTPGEIYTPEEAEAVRNGEVSVEAVVESHADEVFDGTEVVEKDSLKAKLSDTIERYKEQSPEKYEEKKEELDAKLKEANPKKEETK